jgi:predicted DNA-binding transcriptional regulator YafY
MGYKHDYDKAMTRLTTILTRLYQSEELSVTELAQEFAVSTRTIQRDFNDRLYNLPIEQIKKKWKLREGCTIAKTLPIDELVVSQIIEKMSQDIGGEFYTKTKNILSRIQNNEFNPIYTRIDMEDLSGHLQSIAVVEEAIRQKQSFKALYKTDNEAKEVELNPLKLANFEGFWYLIAHDPVNDYAKKYHFKSLSGITPLDKTFERNPKLDDVLENAMGIWFRYKAEPFEVRLSVTPEIAKFFRRKPLSKTQTISSVGTDGSMEITVKITHEMEIIPIVQYWMPNMRVIEPEWIHERIMENIKGYI